jgi:uncharacterized membrane protein
MEALRLTLRAFKTTAVTLLVMVAALLLGFGVPAGWLWIASQLYGQTGAVNGTVAAFIFTAILLTYCFVLLVASWARARMGRGLVDAKQTHRAVWNRSVRDSRYQPGSGEEDPVERVFVAATILAGIGFMIWFAFFAGAPF